MARTRIFLVAGAFVIGTSLFTALVVVGAARRIVATPAVTATIVQAKQEIAAPPRPISLFFVGDVMLDRHVADRIRAAQDDSYPFLKIKPEPSFSQSDLRIMNLEGPVTDRRREPEKTIDFIFDPRFLTTLRNVGFDAASQANNHALDQGRKGADDSRARLTAADFLVFGDEVKDDEVALATTTVRGRRLAFVGFNSVSNAIDDKQAEETMKLARQSADTVIVFMHWGEEYRNRPLPKEEERARWLIDRGADMVIGAHPHWVQGIAIYRGKPIFYSLGNFVFDQDWSTETKQGLAVRAFVTDSETAFDLYPVQIDKSQPYFVAGSARAERLNALAAISDPSLRAQIKEGRVSFAH